MKEKKEYRDVKEIAQAIEHILIKELNLGRTRLGKLFDINYSVFRYNLLKMKKGEKENFETMREILIKIINGVESLGFRYSDIAEELKKILRSYEKLREDKG